nr:exodeoxyribonuclease V subunit gamma [Acidobacteriota bacterium]
PYEPFPDLPPEEPPDLGAVPRPLPEPEERDRTEPLPLLEEIRDAPVKARPAYGTAADLELLVPARPEPADEYLQVHTSNYLPVLVDHLADQMGRYPLPPLEREIIVIQSTGMGRWVTLELAQRQGIAASLHTPFPARFFEELAVRVLGEEGEDPMEDNPFADRELLTWLVYRVLPACVADPLFHPLARYLDDDPQNRKRFQLAARIAACMDDYQVYRPDFLTQWEAGKPTAVKEHPHHDWQAVMWRLLYKEAGRETRLSRYARLLRVLARDEDLSAVLPRRVNLFGVSTLPPLFVKMLGALARHVPVHIFFMSPTWHYWGDIRSDREKLRLTHRFRYRKEDTRYMERGNTLLASLGSQGRDFFKLLEDADTSGSAWHTLDFIKPRYDSMLHALQADVLELVDRDRNGDATPLAVNSGDRSIQVHSCHSPMREMEVLRDQLLDTFRHYPGLQPHEVLVMVPDIRAYAPYIQAVFGVEHQGTPRLPFSLADQAVAREHPLAAAMLRILKTARSRLTAGDVLELLEEPAIRRRFDIGEEDLPVIRAWVDEVRIRWGKDGEARERDFNLPPLEDHTWNAGLERLLMGYATGSVDSLVGKVLPYSQDTLGNVDLLGAFIAFAESLFRFVRPLRRKHALSGWSRLLTDLVNQFFISGSLEEDEALQMLRDAVKKLETAQDAASLGETVGLPVIRYHLERLFGQDDLAAGFITGRITFCALKPMRTIPFRVVCIAGLNDGDFPRGNRAPAFDLIAARKRAGDRSPREDDRYLFLESILAARDRLILSYVGRNILDNSEKAPSTVLSELLDYFDDAFRFPDGKEARSNLVTAHPLQAFSAAYFDGSSTDLFSYSDANFRAAGIRGDQPPSVFIDSPLDDTEPIDSIDLEDLVAFWKEPCKYFCRRVLHLDMPYGVERRDDAEPFDLTGLDRYKLHEMILDRRMNTGWEDEFSVASATGILPPAALGEATYAHERMDLDPLHEELLRQELRGWERGRAELVEVKGKDWQLTGFIDGLGGDKRLQYRPAPIRDKDLVRAWVLHLVMNALADRPEIGGIGATTILGLGKAKKGPRPLERHQLLPLDDAMDALDGLVAGFRKGSRAPAPMFLRTSFIYAEVRWKCNKGTSKADPKKRALQQWRGNSFSRMEGDSRDPYIALCYRGRDPLTEEWMRFHNWASGFWFPLFEALEKDL